MLRRGAGSRVGIRSDGRQDPGEPNPPEAGGASIRTHPARGVPKASSARAPSPRQLHTPSGPPSPPFFRVLSRPYCNVTAGSRSDWEQRRAAAGGRRCGREALRAGGAAGGRRCGALCPLLTYFGAGYADYAVLAHVLPQTALRGRCRRAPEERAGGDPRGLPGVWKVLGRGRVLVLVGPPWCRPDPRPHLPASWCPFHAAAFNLIVLLLLACRARRPRRPWCGSPPQHRRRLLCSALVGRKPEQSQEDWTVCSCCEAYCPPRAHHCHVCHHCVCRMDHHCPWLAPLDQQLHQGVKPEILHPVPLLHWARQSLCHRAGAGCLAGTGRQESSRDGGRRRHGKQPRPNVMLIIMDETPLEQICNQGRKETNQEELCPPKPKLVLLQEVFGQGFVL